MRNITVMTGTRADYGLLYWSLKKISNDPEFDLQIIATCMHLSEKFGETWKLIEADGFQITKKVDLGELGDSSLSVVEQIAVGVPKFFKAFQELRTDLVIILGDRYEMLAAAQAAMFAGVPIAHIHGGEVTEGAFDDMIRHSITKMSTYHFTSHEKYRDRVIQMGEDPESIVNIGAVGLENVVNFNLLSKESLEKEISFSFRAKNILVTYHPVTASDEDGIEDLILALKKFPHIGQIITMPNSDPGHKKIFKELEDYANEAKNVYLTTSLGFLRYLSAMKVCDAVVGNSSSGIIEAPFVGTPTLNIGARQQGRIRANSVIDSSTDNLSITRGLEKVLCKSKQVSELYGNGHCSLKIIEFLKSQRKWEVKKGFFDIS